MASLHTTYSRFVTQLEKMTKIRPTEEANPHEVELLADLIEAASLSLEVIRASYLKHGAHLQPDRPFSYGAVIRPPKKIKPRAQPDSEVKFGTYGCWDYPNGQWERSPTEADIPEIMWQKQLRDPANVFWHDAGTLREWFVAKGWLSV